MKSVNLTLPEIGLIGGTRAALGGGIALLLGERLDAEQRKGIGWTLFLVGALSTLPLAAILLAKQCATDEHEEPMVRTTRRAHHSA